MALQTYTVPDSKIVHSTEVDLNTRPSLFTPIHLVQYDDRLPVLAVTLYNNGKKYILPESASANIRLNKPDYKVAYNPAIGCDATRNILYFEITPQMMAVNGKIAPIVEVVVDGQTAGSSPIVMIIEKNPITDARLQSTNEMKTLVQFVEEAQNSAEAAKKSEDNAAQSAAEAESSAENAEAAAQKALASQTAAEEAADKTAQDKVEADASAKAAAQSATDAAASAEAAAESAQTSSDKADEASASADAAAASAQAAKTSEETASTAATTATEKADAAAQSEENAAASATNAAESAATATEKAGEAATSAETAENAKDEATTKAAEAAESAASALQSKNDAETAATTATEQASAASDSATAAAESEQNAEDWSNQSKSWAIGEGYPERVDEATDNSKYYAGLAKDSEDMVVEKVTVIEENLDDIKNAPTAAQEAKASAESAATDAKRAEDAANQAQSIAQGAKGYYENESALTAAHPDGTAGDWAIVGSTDTVWVWDDESGAWVNSGNKTDLSDYYTKSQADSKVTEALVPYAKSADLSAVATSGDYSDLSGAPSLANVATSGSYTDLKDTPTIPPAVAVKGDKETSYRTGNVNIMAGNVGAIPFYTWTELGITMDTTLDELYEQIIKPGRVHGYNNVVITGWINHLWTIRNEILKAIHPDKYNDGSYTYGQHGPLLCYTDGNTGYFDFLSFDGNEEWTGVKGYDNVGDIRFTVSYVNTHDENPRYKSVFLFTGGRSFKYTDVEVDASLWTSDTSQTGYNFKADVPFNGVTAFFSPIVTFSTDDALSGNYAPVAKTGDGVVTIYAVTKPTTKLTIPLIYCII